MYSQTQSERTLRARQLRAKGYSIGKIAKDLNFSKSTVYRWVKDIEKGNDSHERTERMARTNGTIRTNERNERTLKPNSELKEKRSQRQKYILFSNVSGGKRRTNERTNGTNVRAGMICLVILIVIIVFILLFQDELRNFLAFFGEEKEISGEGSSDEEDKSRGFEDRSIDDV